MTIVDSKEHVSRFWSKIGLLSEIASILRDKPVGKDSISRVLDKISGVIPFKSATLYLLNKKKDSLEEVATLGDKVDLLGFLHFGKGKGVAGWVAKQKKTVLIPGRTPERSGVDDFHDSVLVLPLIVAMDLVGVLCFSNEDIAGFDENRIKFLEIVCDQVAIAIERIIYQSELEIKNRTLENAQSELKRTQSLLIAQEKIKAVTDLAASVNHEVNNPLSAIIGNAQMIELEASDLPPEVSGRIKAIVDGANRISLITHKLLKIDKIVTENYLEGEKETMLNLHKSARCP